MIAFYKHYFFTGSMTVDKTIITTDNHLSVTSDND